MTKDDLKVGMLVVLRDGDGYIIMPSPDRGLIAINSSRQWFSVEHRNDNLTSKVDESMDIVAVCSLPKLYIHYFNFDTNGRTLLWKEPEPVIEMTLKEVCDILGYEVKIIK